MKAEFSNLQEAFTEELDMHRMETTIDVKRTFASEIDPVKSDISSLMELVRVQGERLSRQEEQIDQLKRGDDTMCAPSGSTRAPPSRLPSHQSAFRGSPSLVDEPVETVQKWNRRKKNRGEDAALAQLQDTFASTRQALMEELGL